MVGEAWVTLGCAINPSEAHGRRGGEEKPEKNGAGCSAEAATVLPGVVVLRRVRRGLESGRPGFSLPRAAGVRQLKSPLSGMHRAVR